jgi:hypothetical protein
LQGWAYRVIDLVKEIEKKHDKTEATERWLSATDLEEALNKLGAQGWELVDVHFIFERGEPVVVGFFKRPL